MDADETETEEETGGWGQLLTDTLNAGQTYFYPDVRAFCEAHGAKAIQVADDGGIWLFMKSGGKPVSLVDYGKTRVVALLQ